MRRRLLHLCVVVALTLSGWGGAVAAVMCARAQAGAHDAHDGARRHDASDAGRHASAAGHHASDSDRHASDSGRGNSSDAGGPAAHCPHAQRAASRERTADDSHAPGVAPARGRGLPSCTHCLASPQGAASTAAVVEQTRRGKVQHAAPAAQAPAAAAHDAAFAPPVTPKQGSPPGRASRRHLVLSVFLI